MCLCVGEEDSIFIRVTSDDAKAIKSKQQLSGDKSCRIHMVFIVVDDRPAAVNSGVFVDSR